MGTLEQTTVAWFRRGMLAAWSSLVVLAFTGDAKGQRLPIDPKLPTLWLIGDSTVRNGQDNGGNGQWGWGNPIVHYFDKTKINVQNRGAGGTSSWTVS